ncbi:MAG: peptide MFS transporter, partial [Allomuricauda sp.]
NIGGFVSPLLCGWLGETYGWHYGFGLAGIGMLTGLLFFWSGIKKNVFGDGGRPPSVEVYEKKVMGIPQKHLIPILAFLSAPLIAFLLHSYKSLGAEGTAFADTNIVNLLFYLVGIAVLIYMATIMVKSTADERKKLFMALLITFFMTIFWGFHELHGSVITLFAARNVDLSLINASQTNALNSMFIVILSIPISIMWTYMAKKKINPRTPYKFGMGLVLAGLAFYVVSLSGGSADENGMVPFSYLLWLYFIISVGELFMSPVGLSKITDLSPKRIVAFMMGVWFLSSAYAFQIVGFISKQLAIESTDSNVGGLETLDVYLDGFRLIAIYALVAGAVVLLFGPLMKRLMGNVH